MNPKLVFGLLAGGIVLLGGGSAYVATLASPARSPFAAAADSVTPPSAIGASLRGGSADSVPVAGEGRSKDAPPAPAAVPAASTVAPDAGNTSTPSTVFVWSAVTYVVKAGDTVPGIAKGFDSHGYGAQYAANEEVIGSHPNLVVPGALISISNGVMTIRSPV